MYAVYAAQRPSNRPLARTLHSARQNSVPVGALGWQCLQKQSYGSGSLKGVSLGVVQEAMLRLAKSWYFATGTQIEWSPFLTFCRHDYCFQEPGHVP